METREKQIREAAFIASFEDKPIYKREVVANGIFMATEDVKLRDCDRPVARYFFMRGAQWADANPCMPDKVVKIPERSREEIKELLANWKGTLVVGDDISLSPWISVEDRLPDDGVLVIVAYRWVLGEILYASDVFHIDYGREDYDDIVAWMPIPQLPKGE